MSPLEAPPGGRGNVESQYTYWMMKLHPEWVVLNKGINGQRSDQIFARLDRDVLQEKPDYVIILAGVVDIYQGRATDSVKETLLTMYRRLIQSEIRTIAATVTPYNGMTRSEYESMIELNHWIRRMSDDLGIFFCDTNAVVSDSADPSKLKSSPDGLHPDTEGYRRMGEALAITIERADAG